MENIGTDHNGYIYTSDNLCSQINKLMSKQDKVKKTKKKHVQNFRLDPYRKTWKTSMSISYF